MAYRLGLAEIGKFTSRSWLQKTRLKNQLPYVENYVHSHRKLIQKNYDVKLVVARPP